MANELDNLMAVTTETETHIVGTFPQIIVTGTAEKPCFHIMYREGDEIHLGYSSFDLAYVFQWLNEFFGVTHASAVDPETLRPKGRWIEHEWAEEENGLLVSNFECSNCCRWEREVSDFCPNCGADMRGESE